MRKLPLIFVVDDDLLIQKLIKAELKTLKIDVMCFSYGEESLLEMDMNPDIVILDYIFVQGDKPVLGGLEILKEIRKVNANVPVIILSGQKSGNAVLELIKLGIEEYVIKEKNFTSLLKEAVISILQDNNWLNIKDKWQNTNSKTKN